jgi:hypothetical protein
MQEKHTGTSYQHISATASTWRLQCGVIAMAFAILIATPAQAGQWSLLINGKAVHLDEQPGIEYNEENWGGGVQYDFDMTPGKWVPFVNASVFDDSNKNLSYYAGGGTVRRFALGKEEGALHLDAGLVAFLMVRKDFKGGDPFPGLLPVVSFGTQRVALNVTYIPKVDPKMVPIVFFQLKIGLH